MFAIEFDIYQKFVTTDICRNPAVYCVLFLSFLKEVWNFKKQSVGISFCGLRLESRDSGVHRLFESREPILQGSDLRRREFGMRAKLIGQMLRHVLPDAALRAAGFRVRARNLLLWTVRLQMLRKVLPRNQRSTIFGTFDGLLGAAPLVRLERPLLHLRVAVLTLDGQRVALR